MLATPTESLRVIVANDVGDVGTTTITTVLGGFIPTRGARRYIADILVARYCTLQPPTIRDLADEYGVTYQRIQQLIDSTLEWLAQTGRYTKLPENSRLRAACERKLSKPKKVA